MSDQDNATLRAHFVSESQALVEQCTQDLLAIIQSSLSRPPSREGLWLDSEPINNLYRRGSELIGLAGLIGAEQLQHLLADLERLVNALRLGKLRLTRDILKLGFEAIEHMKRIIAEIDERGVSAANSPSVLLDDILIRIRQMTESGRHFTTRTAEQREKKPQPAFVLDYVDIGSSRSSPRMVELQGGSFWLGSRETDLARYDDERPQHQVKVSAFSMGAVPVTQQLYQEVMDVEASPSYFRGNELPVERVSFFDALQFCNKLSQRMGLLPCYRFEAGQVKWERSANGYRLPTEAEWEYACRAGTETAYYFGDDAAQLGKYAWYRKNSENRTHEVGLKQPNQWGLFDLHGNVWEWCWDWYGTYDTTTSEALLENPAGPGMGDQRVVRGGAFVFGARFLRSAARFGIRPMNQGWNLGFRYVRSVHRELSPG